MASVGAITRVLLGKNVLNRVAATNTGFVKFYSTGKQQLFDKYLLETCVLLDIDGVMYAIVDINSMLSVGNLILTYLQ